MNRPETVVIVVAASAAVAGDRRRSASWPRSRRRAALARFQRPGSASRAGSRVPSSTSVSPSSRFGVAGCPKPHDGQSNRSALQVSRAAQFGHVAASFRQPSPSVHPRGLGRRRRPHDVRVGRVGDDREVGVRLGRRGATGRRPRAPRRSGRAGPGSGCRARAAPRRADRPLGAALARRPRARPGRALAPWRGSARCPTCMLAPVALLTTGSAGAGDGRGEQPGRGRLAVRRRDERHPLPGRQLARAGSARWRASRAR